MAVASVRYIVDDVEDALSFYCEHLGFDEVMYPAPTFAMLERGGLRLVLSAVSDQPGGGQRMSDGTAPTPGGWNRIQLQTDGLDAVVARLRAAGTRFRNEIVEGVGVRQILVEDPSGNLVELFEPLRPEAALDG
jgi:catechol 2,3-dioxygenase-like lactoylglutathione lyase family enzyme